MSKPRCSVLNSEPDASAVSRTMPWKGGKLKFGIGCPVRTNCRGRLLVGQGRGGWITTGCQESQTGIAGIQEPTGRDRSTTDLAASPKRDARGTGVNSTARTLCYLRAYWGAA